MELKSDPENMKDNQPIKNGSDFDILGKDEAFWQRAVKTLAQEQISENNDDISESDKNEHAKHSEKVFCIHCKCQNCLISRQLIIGIHVENEAYNDLWEKLKEIISSYYNMLPNEQDSVINQKYHELQTDSCGIRWFSDGSIDVKKNILAMGNYFSLSNEMTFIIVFNMLYTRDRHQLFELLCLQLTSIILAYREGIKEMTKCMEDDEEYYKPEEFLNYILNGYDRITEIADTLTPLVIEMRDHLQKFSLTWQLMNQCMYYRFLYVDIESRMADCILRLKDAVDAETYKSFVYRFIKFDEEMTSIGQVWEVSLVALEVYRKSTPEQASRVERIAMIRKVIESLRNLNGIPADAIIKDQTLAVDWIVSSEKDDVWLGVLNLIKSEPFYRESKIRPCKCWACLMADGNIVPDICAIPGDASLDVKMKESSGEWYHLAWAVFKHLKDRESYSKPFIHPEMFCVFNDQPCPRMECQVATNLIIGSYPLSFTKFLLRTYQPLSLADREKFLKVPSQSLIRKFCLKKGGAAAKEIMQEADEINHSFLLLNMFWDDDDIADPALRSGLAAALAENFKIDVKFPQKHIIFSYFYALFRIGPSGDLMMDLEWLEKINLANIFKSFGVISNTIHESSTSNNASSSVEAIEMTLSDMQITADVSGGSSNSLELVQFSMKEVADKLSSISLTDDNNENAKKVLENEIKKPLVEALKLAASNKKLEAELKSLQKEHNMLKDMVKGLEQIHGDKDMPVTVTTATKSVSTESNSTNCAHSHQHHNHSQSGSSSPSMSDIDHGKDSGNGADCVCYYCTLFGKNQDLMNARSTETRDRLRKRLHHLQNQKDFTSKTKNFKNISLLLKNGAAAAAAASGPPKVTKCNEAIPHECPNSNKSKSTSSGASMKMKVELELQQRKKKVNPPKVNYANKPEEVKIQRATEINLKSLENLVEYIEGPSSKAVVEQKKADEAAAKKQQKKAKQLELKIRRQIDLHLEQLTKLNGDLQEVVIDAKQVQNQLSQLKAGKGKNKELKKVKVAEEKLSELISRRLRLENDAKGICSDIKILNPNVDLIRECCEMRTISGLLNPPSLTQIPASYVQQQQHQPRPPVATSNTRPIPVRIPPSQIQSKPSEEDPAKRMVTIRRINLPHAEPQVTVTAKGTTPDMDQLLYTFVNGQLVPASSLSPSAFQNGSIQLFMSSNGQKKLVVENRMQQPQRISKINEAPSPVTVMQQQPLQTTDKNKKKQPTPIPAAPVIEKTVEKTKKSLKKADKKKDETPTVNKKESKKHEPSRAPDTEKKLDIKVSEQNKAEASHVDKKKKVKKAYIDPEFASNPFKLLDDEQHSDSEDEISVTSSDLNEPIKRMEAFSLKTTNLKKGKEDKKASKKQSNVQIAQQSSKADKSVQKKPTQPATAKVNKAGSLSSVMSMTQDITFKPIDFVKRPASSLQPPSMNSNSIMDQLNRGVDVEGLQLPPGITLTKVAPSETLGSKRESINRIAQPMQDYSASMRMPADEQMKMGESNGIIMVESNPHAYNSSRANVTADVAGGKKKNKKKKAKSDAAEKSATKLVNAFNQNQQAGVDRMVTLKNPMFYNNPVEPMNSMMRNLQPTPPFVSPMATEPQAASIIRNENGMYTIRNPSFQNAFGPSTAPTTFAPRSQMETINQPFATRQFNQSFDSDAASMDSSQPKCSSVIGSEMKNVLQRRKEQEFAANMDSYQQFGMRPQSTYSHFGGTGMNFNNNGTHCDDNFMSQPSSSSFQAYPMSTYDDLRLQPGQMLNSEVTIHNVTESKMFQNQSKKTPPPIGTPRNGNVESVGTMFGDLLITRPMAPPDMINGNETSIFMSGQNQKISELEADHETFKRFDFNHAPPKKTAMSHAMGDDFDKIQQNSTNSNSPISSVASLDEIFEGGDTKNGNGHQKTSFYSSSGASSLFSSGM